MLHVVADDGPQHEPGPPILDHADEVAGTRDAAAALASIPEEFRIALVLADVQDMAYDRIAEVLDVPVGTVKSRVHRGRLALAAAMGIDPSGREPQAPARDRRRMNRDPSPRSTRPVRRRRARPRERGVVERHLRSCARCRHEVAAARAAREAVRALPTPQAPDIAAHFSPERIANSRSHAPTTRSPWSKAAPFLAAAAVVALVALAVPRLGGSSGDTGTSADAAAEAGGAGSAGHPRLEIDATDYDAASLDAAAAAYASSLAGETAGGLGSRMPPPTRRSPRIKAPPVRRPRRLPRPTRTGSQGRSDRPGRSGACRGRSPGSRARSCG